MINFIKETKIHKTQREAYLKKNIYIYMSAFVKNCICIAQQWWDKKIVQKKVETA